VAEIDPLYLEYLEAEHRRDAAFDARTAAEDAAMRADIVAYHLFERWQAAGGKKVTE
jgi:hypothetical protein